jgi:hypothetical protein
LATELVNLLKKLAKLEGLEKWNEYQFRRFILTFIKVPLGGQIDHQLAKFLLAIARLVRKEHLFCLGLVNDRDGQITEAIE